MRQSLHQNMKDATETALESQSNNPECNLRFPKIVSTKWLKLPVELPKHLHASARNACSLLTTRSIPYSCFVNFSPRVDILYTPPVTPRKPKRQSRRSART